MIQAVMPTYARNELTFERGEGAYLFATDGRKYLDFASGVAVTSLGHAHPRLIAALQQQAEKLWHCSNLFQIEAQKRMAQRLVDTSFADTVFFCNSGAEAMEGAIKVARKYHAESGHPERYRLIACTGSFHGRTLATLAAAGNEKYLKGFGPPVPGFDHVAYGNLNEMRAKVGPETAGVIVELVQGEGGLSVAPAEYFQGLRAMCDEFGLILVFDEVQTGMGRTGKLFAHEWVGVKPDVMALAKGLAGGFPVGACLATEKAAKGMTAGTHGSTFGGNPLAMSVASAVLDIMLEPGFLDRVRQASLRFKQHLAEIKDRHPSVINEVRGEGLLIGVRALVPADELVDALRAEKMIAVSAGDNVVRLLPPLIISDEEIAEGVARLDRACAQIEGLHRTPRQEKAVR